MGKDPKLEATINGSFGSFEREEGRKDDGLLDSGFGFRVSSFDP